jgi:ABC-2 type transport system permease protein
MYVFNYSPIYGTESILQMLVVVILSTFTFLGVGYIIASMARTDDSANALSNLAVFPQFVLSGTFFPIENLPHHLAVVAQFTPLYNFNESIRYITIEGLNLWSPEVMTQLGYLGIWTVIFYFIASRIFSVK